MTRAEYKNQNLNDFEIGFLYRYCYKIETGKNWIPVTCKIKIENKLLGSSPNKNSINSALRLARILYVILF